jgi:hypothetical protein
MFHQAKSATKKMILLKARQRYVAKKTRRKTAPMVFQLRRRPHVGREKESMHSAMTELAAIRRRLNG